MAIVTMIVCDGCSAVWEEKSGYGGRPVHALRRDAVAAGWLAGKVSLEQRYTTGHQDFCTKCVYAASKGNPA
jgi:hypothetical protein